MVPGGKVKFLKNAITQEIFVIARNGFQYNYSPLVMLFQMIY